jgi:hypothetical protein
MKTVADRQADVARENRIGCSAVANRFRDLFAITDVHATAALTSTRPGMRPPRRV